MTIKVTEKRNSTAMLEIETAVANVLEAVAEAGENALRRNLSAGGRTGEHYAGRPRRSSAPGEYSQEQEGTLVGMVDSERLSSLEYVFGLFPETIGEAQQASAQEYGAPQNNLEERANVRRTALEPRTHAEMAAAAKRAAS